MTVADRLFARTIPEPNSGCWLWLGPVSSDGYGRAPNGRKGAWAHRLAWEVTHGEIGLGLCVCHKCDVPSCINPAHLFLGSKRANNADMTAKGRRGSTPGDRHPRAGLTEWDVLAIRNDRRPQREICTVFGIAQSTVSEIKNLRKWRHI